MDKMKMALDLHHIAMALPKQNLESIKPYLTSLEKEIIAGCDEIDGYKNSIALVQASAEQKAKAEGIADMIYGMLGEMGTDFSITKELMIPNLTEAEIVSVLENWLRKWEGRMV